MSVMINEFEVVPEEAPPEPAPGPPPRAEVDLTVLEDELERMLRRKHERSARVHAS